MDNQPTINYKFKLKDEATGKIHRYKQRAGTRGIATALLIERIQQRFKDIKNLVIISCTSSLPV